jgi:hypothetical protein
MDADVRSQQEDEYIDAVLTNVPDRNDRSAPSMHTDEQ